MVIHETIVGGAQLHLESCIAGSNLSWFGNRLGRSNRRIQMGCPANGPAKSLEPRIRTFWDTTPPRVSTWHFGQEKGDGGRNRNYLLPLIFCRYGWRDYSYTDA